MPSSPWSEILIPHPSPSFWPPSASRSFAYATSVLNLNAQSCHNTLLNSAVTFGIFYYFPLLNDNNFRMKVDSLRCASTLSLNFQIPQPPLLNLLLTFLSWVFLLLLLTILPPQPRIIRQSFICLTQNQPSRSAFNYLDPQQCLCQSNWREQNHALLHLEQMSVPGFLNVNHLSIHTKAWLFNPCYLFQFVWHYSPNQIFLLSPCSLSVLHLFSVNTQFFFLLMFIFL